MKHFNFEHFIADLQEHWQNIDVANPNSSVNNDSKQLTSAFEFLLNKQTNKHLCSLCQNEKSELTKNLGFAKVF